MTERQLQSKDVLLEPAMYAGDVIDLYAETERLGVQIWIDSGWGVDGLLGAQTRPHADLTYDQSLRSTLL